MPLSEPKMEGERIQQQRQHATVPPPLSYRHRSRPAQIHNQEEMDLQDDHDAATTRSDVSAITTFDINNKKNTSDGGTTNANNTNKGSDTMMGTVREIVATFSASTSAASGAGAATFAPTSIQSAPAGENQLAAVAGPLASVFNGNTESTAAPSPPNYFSLEGEAADDEDSIAAQRTNSSNTNSKLSVGLGMKPPRSPSVQSFRLQRDAVWQNTVQVQVVNSVGKGGEKGEGVGEGEGAVTKSDKGDGKAKEDNEDDKKAEVITVSNSSSSSDISTRQEEQTEKQKENESARRREQHPLQPPIPIVLTGKVNLGLGQGLGGGGLFPPVALPQSASSALLLPQLLPLPAAAGASTKPLVPAPNNAKKGSSSSSPTSNQQAALLPSTSTPSVPHPSITPKPNGGPRVSGAAPPPPHIAAPSSSSSLPHGPLPSSVPLPPIMSTTNGVSISGKGRSSEDISVGGFSSFTSSSQSFQQEGAHRDESKGSLPSVSQGSGSSARGGDKKEQKEGKGEKEARLAPPPRSEPEAFPQLPQSRRTDGAPLVMAAEEGVPKTSEVFTNVVQTQQQQEPSPASASAVPSLPSAAASTPSAPLATSLFLFARPTAQQQQQQHRINMVTARDGEEEKKKSSGKMAATVRGNGKAYNYASTINNNGAPLVSNHHANGNNNENNDDIIVEDYEGSITTSTSTTSTAVPSTTASLLPHQWKAGAISSTIVSRPRRPTPPPSPPPQPLAAPTSVDYDFAPMRLVPHTGGTTATNSILAASSTYSSSSSSSSSTVVTGNHDHRTAGGVTSSVAAVRGTATASTVDAGGPSLSYGHLSLNTPSPQLMMMPFSTDSSSFPATERATSRTYPAVPVVASSGASRTPNLFSGGTTNLSSAAPSMGANSAGAVAAPSAAMPFGTDAVGGGGGGARRPLFINNNGTGSGTSSASGASTLLFGASNSTGAAMSNMTVLGGNSVEAEAQSGVGSKTTSNSFTSAPTTTSAASISSSNNPNAPPSTGNGLVLVGGRGVGGSSRRRNIIIGQSASLLPPPSTTTAPPSLAMASTNARSVKY